MKLKINFFVFALTAFLFCVNAFAQPGDVSIQEEARKLRTRVDDAIEDNKKNREANGFSAHHENYFLPFALSDYKYEREKAEVKFQLSIKQRLFRVSGWALFFGYTQKSFWQYYDFKDSSPFRENNFNPEAFIRSDSWGGFYFSAGAEHESNGAKVETSRSWNRIYFTPAFIGDYFQIEAKAWYRMKEKKKSSPDDASGDDNPDILRYYGYGELRIKTRIKNWVYFSTMVRYNPKYRHGALCQEIFVPMDISNMSWMLQYWYGYGESLVDYKVKQHKVGIGLALTR